MTPEEAVEHLRGRTLVAVTRASVDQAKALHARCLTRDIPAIMRRPSDPGG